MSEYTVGKIMPSTMKRKLEFQELHLRRAILIYMMMSQQAKLAILHGRPPQARRAINLDRENILFDSMRDCWMIHNDIDPGNILS